MDYSLLRHQILDNCKFLFPDRNLALVCGKELSNPTSKSRSPAVDYMRVVDLSPEAAYQLNGGVLAEGRSSKGPGTALVLLFNRTQTMIDEQLERRRRESQLLAESVRMRLEEAEGETDEVLRELERRFSRRAQLVAEAWKLKDLESIREVVEEFERKLVMVAKAKAAELEAAEGGVSLTAGASPGEKIGHDLLPGLFNLGGQETERDEESSSSPPQVENQQVAVQENNGVQLGSAGTGAVLVVARNLVIADDSTSTVTGTVDCRQQTVQRVFCANCSRPSSSDNKQPTSNVKEISIASTEPRNDSRQAEQEFLASMENLSRPVTATSAENGPPQASESVPVMVELEANSPPLLEPETPILERDDSDTISISSTFVKSQYEIVHMEDLPAVGSPELALIDKQFAERMAGKKGTWSFSIMSIIRRKGSTSSSS